MHGRGDEEKGLVYGMGRSGGWLRGNGALALVEYAPRAMHLIAYRLQTLRYFAMVGIHLTLNDVLGYRPTADLVAKVNALQPALKRLRHHIADDRLR